MKQAGTPCIPVFILLFFVSPFCRSDDRLWPAKPLSAGDTIVSKGGDFALGFFSPDSSNTSLYLGIWYHNMAGRTVVWTANRDDPIPAASSPTLAITNSSDLVLSDSQGHTPWAVKSDIKGSMGVTAVLLDTGNFVVQSPNDTSIWQTFDHPTDTLLPGRTMLSKKGHVVWRLIASKGLNDLSTGVFSMSLDPSSDLQFFIWNGARPYRRRIFNGEMAVGTLYQNTVLYEAIIRTRDGFYYDFRVSGASQYAHLTLDYMGVLTLSLNNRSSWRTITAPPASCNIYASCGPFGYCDYTAAVPTCSCLDGFEPSGPNFSSGCRRIQDLKCSKQNHFVTLPRMMLPDKFLRVHNRSFGDCMTECSNNCLCTAYAYANYSTNDATADQSRCLVWTGELIDTGKFSEYGENLYLRLANSPVQKNNKLVKILLPTMACVLILACTALVSICKYKGTRKKKEIHNGPMLGYLSSFSEMGGEHVEFPFFSFEDIAAATDNFSEFNQIGSGGFGKVYKGMLQGDKEVAIKRLSKGSAQGIEEFKNEIILIAKLQHRNLVRLLGCCIYGDERLLIYEYLPNKSLDTFLFDDTRQHELDWSIRFKIIKGVARGLLYLHQDSRLTIIHRDLKPSNILMDSEMTPKISDFGMARIFGGNKQEASTTRVVGTYGYMSPEYVMGGAFSVKSDTYSFGVLLLEIVSGLKITSPQLVMNFVGLTAYAWRLWVDGKATELVHSSVIESCSLDEVLRCIHVGLLCVQDCPNDRPLMASVTFMLENESALLPAPKQPAYFPLRSLEPGKIRGNSMNLVSITTLDGR
ncbi:G-type lectin S-receptor-like serine/threonine-protein kinase B120 isoform X2 [Aegilops tauschii subsp. strangulata]|uniref:Receptor-like serine/threonine-protein kinase n=1 Tax=Aegilops tauschii TaxID=37682 RepID=M8B6H7_AEGTA